MMFWTGFAVGLLIGCLLGLAAILVWENLR